jgi:hypothetical protein
VAGGSQVATLPSAVTAGNGYLLGIRHDGQGSTNTLTYQTVSAQVIKEGHASTGVTSGTLTGFGEATWFISDGSGWTVCAHVPALTRKGEVLVVTDRLTAAPTSPTAGAVYLISGTPTGTWLALGFAADDLVQASGVGTWTELVVSDGMLVYVTDEALNYQRQTGAWVPWSNILAPAATTMRRAVFQDQKSNNTAGGTPVGNNAWYARALNTSVANTITVANGASSDASLASNQITLPAGAYFVSWQSSFAGTSSTTTRIKSTTTSTELLGANAFCDGTTNTTQILAGNGVLTLSAPETFELQYMVTASPATTGLGFSHGSSLSNTEVYATVTIIDLATVKGPIGPTGAQGNAGTDGALGLWNWETSTSAGPASGAIRFNNATFASVTAVYLHETDLNATALAALLATWDDSTSTIKGTLLCRENGSGGNFFAADVTALTDNGSDVTFTVTHRASGGSFSAGDDIGVVFVPKGDKGDTGATGAAGANGSAGATGATGATGPNVGLDYTWSTATSGDPGTGKLLVNNASPASATALHISELNRLSASQDAYISTWDDGTTASDKGVVRILDVAAPGTNFLEYRITGTLTDAGAYDTFPVTYIGGAGTITNASTVAVMFFRTGDKGSDGAGTGDVVGPAASVDSEIALYNSTTGKLIKRASLTGIVKAASGVASAATEGADYYAPAGTDVAVTDGGTGRSTGTTAYALVATGTTATGAQQTLANGATTEILVGGGASALPVWTTAQGSGAPVRATSPTLTTPVLGVATATSINKVALTAPATSATITVADGKTLTASNTLTLAGTDSTTMTFPATTSTVLTTGNTATITKGYSVTPNNLGTISSGTVTPDPANGNYQYMTNNGAHTLAVPASDCAVDILVTNGASAGTITISGSYTAPSGGGGDTYATTNANRYLLMIRRINSISTYAWKALQ